MEWIDVVISENGMKVVVLGGRGMLGHDLVTLATRVGHEAIRIRIHFCISVTSTGTTGIWPVLADSPVARRRPVSQTAAAISSERVLIAIPMDSGFVCVRITVTEWLPAGTSHCSSP